MPWKETSVVDRRLDFVQRCLQKDHSIGALCDVYGISRTIGHKWLKRYREGGEPALADRSRAPHSNPRATPDEIVGLVLECRLEWGWGAKKIHARLATERPELKLPAVSTISAILKRAGLTKPQKRRRRGPPRSEPFVACERPNDLWCMDYMGDFLLGNRSRCYPLTVTDSFSRALLCCRACDRISGEIVQQEFTRLFREHGLPLTIRSDNGPPFASHGAGGLTRLAVWLLKLGIRLERIDPGHPEQNGRHERMHATLRAATVRPPRHTRSAQQRSFNEYRQVFNFERPHEALGQVTPASLYVPSPRPFPRGGPQDPVYPGHFELRKVQPVGQIRWRGHLVFVSGALAGERVSLEETDEGLWTVRFAHHWLGTLSARDKTPKLIRPIRRGRRHG